jgi:thiosulfate/3-mercaptopyruvate sulfurtransferase
MTKAMPNLVTASWLKAEIGARDLVILDASWYMPAEGRDPEEEFRAGHIPGTRRFDFDKQVKDQANPLPHMLPSPEDFAAAARALGVTSESRVVVYDGAGIFAAPRAWWMFKVMGHDQVAVLNGGLPAWVEAGGEVAQGESSAATPGDFEARLDRARLTEAGELKAALESESAQVVDARSAPRFEGAQPEPRAGLRSGHMPGAINLPFDRLLEHGRYKEPEELRRIWSAIGVNGEQPVMASCGSGVTASVLALGAELAGLAPVAVYDGSWSEWGQEHRTYLPVVQGPAQ